MLSFIDLTSLNENDTPETITALCHQAKSSDTSPAAVCVFPHFVEHAVSLLKGSGIKIATVANFPSGENTLESVMHSIQQSIKNGAEEIDVVFPYRAYLSGNKKYSCHFIQSCKEGCGESIVLKVILETGALQELSLISDASELLIDVGADFLKTSTGKISIGATLPAAEVMLQSIKKSRKNVGFKASGGIRTLAQATEYRELANQIMGKAWVTPAHFRIGTSKNL